MRCVRDESRGYLLFTNDTLGHHIPIYIWIIQYLYIISYFATHLNGKWSESVYTTRVSEKDVHASNSTNSPNQNMIKHIKCSIGVNFQIFASPGVAARQLK